MASTISSSAPSIGSSRREGGDLFPLVLVPTGSEARGLGAGKTQVFVPIWVQKSFGRWTTYGGGGLQFASGERDAVAGWLVQRQLIEGLSLGIEEFLTVPLKGGPPRFA